MANEILTLGKQREWKQRRRELCQEMKRKPLALIVSVEEKEWGNLAEALNSVSLSLCVSLRFLSTRRKSKREVFERKIGSQSGVLLSKCKSVCVTARWQSCCQLPSFWKREGRGPKVFLISCSEMPLSFLKFTGQALLFLEWVRGMKGSS